MHRYIDAVFVASYHSLELRMRMITGKTHGMATHVKYSSACISSHLRVRNAQLALLSSPLCPTIYRCLPSASPSVSALIVRRVAHTPRPTLRKQDGLSMGIRCPSIWYRNQAQSLVAPAKSPACGRAIEPSDYIDSILLGAIVGLALVSSCLP